MYMVPGVIFTISLASFLPRGAVQRGCYDWDKPMLSRAPLLRTSVNPTTATDVLSTGINPHARVPLYQSKTKDEKRRHCWCTNQKTEKQMSVAVYNDKAET